MLQPRLARLLRSNQIGQFFFIFTTESPPTPDVATDIAESTIAELDIVNDVSILRMI